MDGKKKVEPLKLFLQREDREIHIRVKDGHTLIDILKEAGLPLDGVLIFNEGKPIPLDSPASEFGSLTVINVSSGG